ncbi:MAG: hypothetical protein GY920_06955, partial [Aliivibrio sp.]|nr:hypothetical protein [Aliivibrio sp.]
MKRKSDAAIRQQFVTQRRKDSGLVTKRIHVSDISLDILDAIGTKLGFSRKELRNSENLSAIIAICFHLGLSWEQIESKLVNLPSEKGRSTMITGI